MHILARVFRWPAESQRDSGTEPRVARNELPWGNLDDEYNPERAVAPCCGSDFGGAACRLKSAFLFALVSLVPQFILQGAGAPTNSVLLKTVENRVMIQRACSNAK